MSGDGWGPWIGWNGGECPVDGYATVEVCCYDFTDVDEARKYEWGHGELCDPIIAYRVKKVPVVEVKTETVKIEMFGCVPVDNVFKHNSHTFMLSGDFECTYTDGKLTKVHWEAE